MYAVNAPTAIQDQYLVLVRIARPCPFDSQLIPPISPGLSGNSGARSDVIVVMPLPLLLLLSGRELGPASALGCSQGLGGGWKVGAEEDIIDARLAIRGYDRLLISAAE